MTKRIFIVILSIYWCLSVFGGINMNPIPNKNAIIKFGNARFTVLTPSMFRMEWSETGKFEDRASFAVINRSLPALDCEVYETKEWFHIETDELILKYRANSGKFNSENLKIVNKSEKTHFSWHAGLEDKGNLGGTVRTLDQASGEIPIGPGLISRDGWVLYDDSKTLLFDESGWAVPREGNSIDWYFLGYGHNYKQALYDFSQISGGIPLPPRWSFGSWWSRYWAYTEDELKGIVGEFREHEVPLDVLVVDMDWHLPGWTGYTWNKEYFPNPDKFLEWCHSESLHVTLNLHPHDGVRDHESAFREFAEHMNLDPDNTDHIPFDIADQKYMKGYFKYLHHPMEEQGVDFWWIDWQQGEASKIPGLDPLFWLNHLHWLDMEENPKRWNLRPMMFSRWGGLGGQRYQIGFSGDTHSIWESLEFQSYFTACAGNVLYPYWSHDIGGHFYGPVDDELYLRWIQFAALNPFLRTHATKNPRAERRIWAFPDEIFENAREAFYLRYSLLPYIYTTARECYDKAIPLVRPLYYEYPELDEAYSYKSQYLFGSQLLVAPVAAPSDPASGCTYKEVWIPPGTWFNWFTGEKFSNPSKVRLMVPLSEIPLFAKAGSIVPTMPMRYRIGNEPLDKIILNMFPGEKSEFTLYDDDGISPGYINDEYSLTNITMKSNEWGCEVVIGETVGRYQGIPDTRDYTVILWDRFPPKEITVNGKKLERKVEVDVDKSISCWWYDYNDFCVVINFPESKLEEEYILKIQLSDLNESCLWNGVRGKLKTLIEMTELFGRSTPKKVKKVIKQIESCSIKQDDKFFYKIANSILEDWGEYASEFASAGSEIELQKMAFLRMNGIINKFEIRQVDFGRFQSVLDIQVLEPANDLSMRFEFTLPDGWKTEFTPGRLIKLDGNFPVLEKINFASEDSLVTSIIGLKLIYSMCDYECKVEINRQILPSINKWWVIGPFENPWRDGLENVFPPELEFNRYVKYLGKNDIPIRWDKIVREINPSSDLLGEFVVDLIDICGEGITDAVAYAATFIHSEIDAEAVLALGTDDGVQVWLDGKEIFKNNVGRPYSPKQDFVPIDLHKGYNFLLLKINQGGGEWSFCGHIEDKNGSPIPGISYHLER